MKIGIDKSQTHVGVAFLLLWFQYKGVPSLSAYYVYRYCPGGPDSDFEYSTQSYTGYEVPVVWQGILYWCKPYQTFMKLFSFSFNLNKIAYEY